MLSHSSILCNSVIIFTFQLQKTPVPYTALYLWYKHLLFPTKCHTDIIPFHIYISWHSCFAFSQLFVMDSPNLRTKMLIFILKQGQRKVFFNEKTLSIISNVKHKSNSYKKE